MSSKETTRLVHVGEFVAEVLVTLIVSDDEWSPYLSVEDAKKLDAVRVALKRQDLRDASRYARVFRLTPVSV
jgi:hypothetical protein